MSGAPLSEREFGLFQRFLYETAGIQLSAAKQALVAGRLAGRLRQCGSASYSAYFELLRSGAAPDETQLAVDLLTTNETYFFRESRHFDFLRAQTQRLVPRAPPFRVWSAASSSGEEAYSIAMLLADCLPHQPWEVLGSDISLRVLRRARLGHYPMARARQIPRPYLQRFCLKGNGPYQDSLLIAPELRRRVEFVQANLNEPLPDLGRFDMIFLRNVMIYFDLPTKRGVVERVQALLKPGGHLCIGHAETLHQVCDTLTPVAPAIYRKAGPDGR
jgi:chemotaxis protein methyltransferase CheR